MGQESGDIWLFAYGSVMWRPGFDSVEQRPALLRGYHRAFCVTSLHYRGTPERPGLVLGLEPGGSCRGIAFRVAGRRAQEVLRVLDERENIYAAYQRRLVSVTARGGRLSAWAYLADRKSTQYAGRLSRESIVELLLQGEGLSGTGAEYLESTARHLDALGIPDKGLHELLEAVRERQLGRFQV